MATRDEHERFESHYRRFVEAYVSRRIGASEVADVVAEVFATAWRRRRDVPADALPWLYRTARNVLGNRYRSADRLDRLREQLRSVPLERPRDPADRVVERDRLVQAFASLHEDERELLLLVAWEGLSTAELATVLDVSPGAASVRLHRARRRLEAGLARTDLPVEENR